MGTYVHAVLDALSVLEPRVQGDLLLWPHSRNEIPGNVIDSMELGLGDAAWCVCLALYRAVAMNVELYEAVSFVNLLHYYTLSLD